MKHELSYTLGLILLGLAGIAVSPADANTVAAGPYYATPSWDQKLQCDTQLTCPRFIVLSNWNSEAVLDRETGLVWQRTPTNATLSDQAGAMRNCWQAAIGGRQGWRLPRVEEFMSLADPSNFANSSLPSGYPFLNVFYESVDGIPNDLGHYWTADLYPGSAGLGTVMEFQEFRGAPGHSSRATFFGNSVTFPQGVWCVRTGNGAPFRQ
jgi:hypothetical protein